MIAVRLGVASVAPMHFQISWSTKLFPAYVGMISHIVNLYNQDLHNVFTKVCEHDK
ncbi:hypothetical protein BHAP_0629 [Bifidobacterium hapali]|uniref:Uncharacterized protein n=1 Tax=Bifidobacterium hapali TaxID=1630172 RepID=A0A261G1P3_9BIFI|nr:hypothetical protein BHAP_0629 [Bifidobacterium hapali]